jgi:hypothetical protein
MILLESSGPASTTVLYYSGFLSARKKGTYNVFKLREKQDIRNLVIAIQDKNGGYPLSEQDPTILPVTTITADHDSMVTTEASFGSGNKKQSFRRLSK